MANNQYFPTQMNYPMKWRSKATWQFGSLAAAATWRIQLQNRKPIDSEDREAERGIERGVLKVVRFADDLCHPNKWLLPSLYNKLVVLEQLSKHFSLST